MIKCANDLEAVPTHNGATSFCAECSRILCTACATICTESGHTVTPFVLPSVPPIGFSKIPTVESVESPQPAEIEIKVESAIPPQIDGTTVGEARDIVAERSALQARIEALESDLALIAQGKDAAERALAYERQRARELAQNSMFSLKRDWVGLTNELKMLKGETIGEDPKENVEYQEALVIDFVNRLRIGALAELETEDDDTLYVKAKAYEVWYKACAAVLANRIQGIKIKRTGEFEQTKRDLKESENSKKREREQLKADKRRRTPEEKMFESLVVLLGSEDAAHAQMQIMKDAAARMQEKPTN